MRTGSLKPRSYAHGLERLQTIVTGESMTRQDQAHLADINVIYAKTQRGEIVLASQRMPEFGDFSDVNSYDVMLEKINEAEDAFMSLSAEERKKYDDSPAEYYARKMKEAQESFDGKAKAKLEKEKREKEEQELEHAKSLVAKASSKSSD